jgi:hypothetical protein
MLHSGLERPVSAFLLITHTLLNQFFQSLGGQIVLNPGIQ